jgi:tetratricopeptide (TPR) repeat protein
LKNIFVFILIFTLNHQKIYSNDNDKLNLLLSEYITNIIEFSQSKNSVQSFLKLNSLYTDINEIHENELFGCERSSGLMNYLTIIKKDFNHNLIVTIENEKILTCNRYNEGKSYRFGTFQKTIKFNNKSKVIDILVMIDVTNSIYKIEGVFLKLLDIESRILNSCSKPVTNEEKKNEEKKLRTYLKSHIDKAKNLINQKRYTEALQYFKEVLVIDKTHKTAIDGVLFCERLIDTSEKKKNIIRLLEFENYEKILKLIDKQSNANLIFGREWVSKINEQCLQGIKRKKLKRLLKSGDYYLSIGQYRKARNLFESALKLSTNNSEIINKIAQSKNGDPNYVKKQLKLAFDNAVRSKKNYLSTFKTYKKYENGNLLTGENYLFMMLMMLDLHKRVAKPMGYSRNQAKHLSREYFYKTKRTGLDVSFYETQVFTKNIEKRKN